MGPLAAIALIIVCVIWGICTIADSIDEGKRKAAGGKPPARPRDCSFCPWTSGYLFNGEPRLLDIQNHLITHTIARGLDR